MTPGGAGWGDKASLKNCGNFSINLTFLENFIKDRLSWAPGEGPAPILGLNTSSLLAGTHRNLGQQESILSHTPYPLEGS